MIVPFVSGATAMGYFILGLFFLRYWRDTRERFFAMFSAAFWLLFCERVLMLFQPPDSEGKSLVYFIRLIAFLIVIVAVIHKARSKHRILPESTEN